MVIGFEGWGKKKKHTKDAKLNNSEGAIHWVN
jgi:hypothetical protein